ncbi:hypothetical protein A374_02019 [Fictibacillus macauensis ZFHKF-1]|uniref:Uncharacterized protein n=1 Tax=Fictibacillus macauensis ZFHKF-1 TaxID=1196324 RepID=I8J5D2_9BACL|nr:GTP-binding protein [Fictibacillus macauensis]EIT86991.1 hypothetical protein A374_02019 [Fictibacillus macauensis ZFHKF-1]
MRIPTYVISGFLGAGKTTVLLQLLSYCKEQGLKPGIVLNELGEINVEGHLFKGETLVELLDGCICCTIQDDLREELRFFLEPANAVDVLLIEGTGIANPKEIVETLDDPRLQNGFEVKSVISLLDASNYLKQQRYLLNKHVRTLLEEQLTSATIVLLNKIDLIDQKVKDKIYKKLEKILHSSVPIIETSYGKCECAVLLQERVSHVVVHQEGATTYHAAPRHAFQAFKIEGFHTVERIAFQRWLKSLPPAVLRGKGILTLAAPQGMYQFQWASDELELQRIREDLPETSCVILIGYELPIEQIVASFHSEVLQRDYVK